MAGIFRNVFNTVKKAGKDIGKQVVRSGQDTAKVLDNKFVKLGAAAVLTATGVGAPAAAAILATSGGIAGAAKRGGNWRSALTGAATGAAAAGTTAVAKKALTSLGGFRSTILKRLPAPAKPAGLLPATTTARPREAVLIEEREEKAVLNANRDKTMETPTSTAPTAALVGATPADVAPAVAQAEAGAPGFDWKMWLPIIVIGLLLLALFMSGRGKKGS